MSVEKLKMTLLRFCAEILNSANLINFFWLGRAF